MEPKAITTEQELLAHVLSLPERTARISGIATLMAA